MTRVSMAVAAALLLLVLLLTARPSLVGAQATTITGTWSAERSDTPGKLHVEFSSDDGGGKSHVDSSFDQDGARFGVTQAQLDSAGTHVAFTFAREAGSFACEGWIAHGQGGGPFTFSPSAAYAADMRARGYGGLTARDQMVAAVLDIRTGYVDAIASAGYPHLPFEKLIAFRAMKIDESYARAMRAAFPNGALDADQLISLRALQVTPEYLAQMRAAGIAIGGAEEAVQLRALKVDPDYVRSLAAVGYAHLTTEQLVRLRALRIDAAYVKRVQAHGFNNLSVDQLVRLKAMHVI
jgi:hypothetical protein